VRTERKLLCGFFLDVRAEHELLCGFLRHPR
jgi:hypothetical protein